MEARVIEKLRQYNALRSSALELAFRYVPKNIVEQNSFFHSVLIFCTTTVIVSIFATTRKLTLFSLHPICMTIGTVLFLAEGIVSYRNDTLLEFFSPIMQHNKKTKVRAIHQTLQLGGAVFLGLGMLFILANKFEFEHSVIPMSIHSILGTLTILLIIVQVVSGLEKIQHMESSNKRVRRWHGESGLLVWDMLCLTLLLGLMSFLAISFTNLLVLVIVIAAWMTVHVQMISKSSMHKFDSSSSMDGEGAGSGNAAGLARTDSFGTLDVETALALEGRDDDNLITNNDARDADSEYASR